jgi:hypothetical protein
MAKHKAGDHDKPKGEEGDVAPYPPPVPDAAGERTGNVPPAKQLPAEPPADENPDRTAAVPPAGDAIAAAVPPAGDAIAAADAELARLAAENADLRRQLGKEQPQTAAGKPGRKAKVTLAGRTPDVVEIAADAREPEAAAVAAYQAKHGIWSMPSQPHVELDPKD